MINCFQVLLSFNLRCYTKVVFVTDRRRAPPARPGAALFVENVMQVGRLKHSNPVSGMTTP